jgi:hypothetical protein
MAESLHQSPQTVATADSGVTVSVGRVVFTDDTVMLSGSHNGLVGNLPAQSARLLAAALIAAADVIDPSGARPVIIHRGGGYAG